MHWVDTHCHVDLYSDYPTLITEVEGAQIYTIAVTNTPSVFRPCAALVQSTRFLRAALGLHPQLVRQRQHELDLLCELIGETRYIGEIGLDFTTQDEYERALQMKVFTTVLDQCSLFGNKILTIHSRRAATKIVDTIGNAYPGHIILHWYSGSLKTLERAVAYGFYFSVNSAMLMSTSGRQIAASIPADRLLTESDGPFVQLDGHPARPSDMPHIVARLAALRKVPASVLARTIYSNLCNML